MTAPFRRLAGYATTAATLALLALSPAMPVSALDQAANTIRVTENQTVEKEFGPLASMNPLPGLPSAPPPVPVPKWNTPETCRQVTYCDVIPLEVVLPPTLKPADEFFVSVTLSWQTSQVPATDYSKAQDVNDLDLIVWNDPVAEDGQPAKAGASAAQPENLRLFSPRLGKYSIVVFNYLGPNTGYKLKVEYKPERIEPPFELLPPEFTAPATFEPPFEAPFEAPDAPPTLPIDTSGAEEPEPVSAPPPAPVETAPPALTPVAIDPDPDFTNFADDAFDEQLAAPVTDVLTEKQVKAVGPPRPASTSSLVFWLAIVPMLLAAAAGLWLSKKGSAVLKLR